MLAVVAAVAVVVDVVAAVVVEVAVAVAAVAVVELERGLEQQGLELVLAVGVLPVECHLLHRALSFYRSRIHSNHLCA